MVYSAPCSLHSHRRLGSEQPATLFMSARTMDRFGVKQGGTVTVCFPARRIALAVQPVPVTDIKDEPTGMERLYMPTNIVRRFHLPLEQPLHMHLTPTQELHIGPIVGIYCQRYPGPSRYGPQTRFFRQLIRIGQQMGMFVYVFEGSDIDRRGAMIYGSTWIAHRGWVRRWCPLPHVFYDRGMVAAADMRAHRWLRLRGVQQFNSYVGSKLWVYRLMADVPHLATYIPETRVLRRPQDLAAMVRRHDVVYVKSANGGKGIGIWVVQKHPAGGYTYRFTDAATRIHRGRAPNLTPIALRLLSAPRQPWLIQPRLDLLRWRGRIFDVRVLIQRDERGKLQVTGTAARIGRRGSIISNIFGGGDAQPLRPLLQECLGLNTDEANKVHDEIEAVSLDVARLIHRAARRTGTIGELGIDIAVDRAGRLWFLEANSRTGRNVFHLASMHDRARASYERPLLYARYVAGFGPAPSTTKEPTN